MPAKKFAHISVIFATIFAIKGAMGNDSKAISRIGDYTRPMSFEPNREQAGEFVAQGPGYSLLLSGREAVMVVEQTSSKPGSRIKTAAVTPTTVRMKVVGVNASARSSALEKQPSKSNYFIGNVPEKWQTNIANYSKIRYGGVYPGIDLIYYGNQSQLEYDFVVAPGANPRNIALEFDGSVKIRLDGSDELILHAGAGELLWHRPVAYQEVDGRRKVVACSYARRGQKLGFRLGTYDRGKPLIIDPVLEYSTYLGGLLISAGQGIAVDKSGNTYVTGYTFSNNFPIKNAYQDNNTGATNGGSNVFVSKFDGSGHLIYSTYLGGSGMPPGGGFDPSDIGNAIAVDVHGNAYIAGATVSFDFPVKDAFQSSLKAIEQGNRNAFVTKLDAAGSGLIYSTFLGGSVNDAGFGIALDNYGDAYVTGVTQSPDFPIKHAFQSTLKAGSSSNAFLTKFDAAGNALIYSTFLGGSGADQAYGVAVDAQGHAYVTGMTTSRDFPTKDAFQAEIKNENYASNAFVTKFSTAGNELVYSTYLGGSGNLPGTTFGDYATSIAVDRDGRAYLTGVTVSTNFPLKNAFQKKLKSVFGNAFVTKFDTAGTGLVYSTYLGGSGNSTFNYGSGDIGNGIAVDQYGNAYVTGQTFSANFPILNAFQSKLKSGFGNSFVTKIDAAGSALLYSSYLGGSGYKNTTGFSDLASGIAVDADGSAHLTGITDSSDFPIKNAFQHTLKGYYNAFVTKISAK